jgi:hypothetical protein
MIKKLKEEITINELTEGLPDAFKTFLKYCRRLEFDEEPNYDYCKNLFEECLAKRGHCNDDFYDWFLKKLGKKIPESDFYDYVEYSKDSIATQNKRLSKLRAIRKNSSLKKNLDNELGDSSTKSKISGGPSLSIMKEGDDKNSMNSMLSKDLHQ